MQFEIYYSVIENIKNLKIITMVKSTIIINCFSNLGNELKLG